MPPKERKPVVINGEHAEKYESRECDGVCITERYAYKIKYLEMFGGALVNGGKNPQYRSSIQEIFERFKKTDTLGIPIPQKISIFEGDLLEDNERNCVVALKMSKIENGIFFQLAKKGGTSTLLRQINDIDDWIMAQRFERILQCAKDNRLSDPQGFVNIQSSQPIVFIDIHFQSFPNTKFDDLIAAARLKKETLHRS
jgi:hypothetical protein